MKARLCNVLIFRSVAENLPKQVYEHELPILKEIFGHGRVVPDESKKINHPIVELDHDEEYTRLEYVYQMHPEIKMSNCQFIYRQMDEKQMVEKAEKMYQNEQQAEVGGDGPTPTKPARETKFVTLAERPIGEIREFLDSIEFAYFKGASKETLLQSYDNHLREKSEEAQKKVENPELDPVGA